MKFTMLLLLLCLTGCAHKPSPEQAARADYGAYPDNYKEIVEGYLQRALKDPDSARYSYWRGPSKGFVYDMAGVYYGYKVCSEVNAKNSYGGYTGSKPYYFIVNNNKVIKADGGHRPGTIGEETVNKICNSVQLSKNP